MEGKWCILHYLLIGMSGSLTAPSLINIIQIPSLQWATVQNLHDKWSVHPLASTHVSFTNPKA